MRGELEGGGEGEGMGEVEEELGGWAFDGSMRWVRCGSSASGYGVGRAHEFEWVFIILDTTIKFKIRKCSEELIELYTSDIDVFSTNEQQVISSLAKSLKSARQVKRPPMTAL